MKVLKAIFILTTIFLLFTCKKKDKLTGDASVLIGDWRLIDYKCNCCQGVSPVMTNLKLTLRKQGKYVLYEDNKKLEHGRLILVDGLYTFNRDDIKGRSSGLKSQPILEYTSDTLKMEMPQKCGSYYIWTKM